MKPYFEISFKNQDESSYTYSADENDFSHHAMEFNTFNLSIKATNIYNQIDDEPSSLDLKVIYHYSDHQSQKKA